MSKEERIYGLHTVKAVLERHPDHVHAIWVQDSRKGKRMTSITDIARHHHITLHKVSRDELDEITNGGHHQGVVAQCRSLPVNELSLEAVLDRLEAPAFLLVLDGVQDPHNLGACLRTAAAAGVHAVIAPRDRAVGLTDTARKVASGAAETIPFIQVPNLAQTLKQLKDKGVWLVGATSDAEQSIYDIDLAGPVVLVLGGEGKGLRRLTREACDYLAHIPITDKVESLNISVAAGVSCFEVVRQRQSQR